MNPDKCYFCIKPPINHCLCLKNPACKIHFQSKLNSHSYHMQLSEASIGIFNLNPFIKFLKGEGPGPASIKKSNFESINQICKEISNFYNINLDSISSAAIEMKFCNNSKILAILDADNVLNLWKLSDELGFNENYINRIEIQNNNPILTRNSYLFISSKYQFVGLLGKSKISLFYFANYSKIIDIDVCYDINQKIILSSNEDFLIILNQKMIKIVDLRYFTILAQFYISFQSGFCFMTSNNYLHVSAGFDQNLLNIYDVSNLPSFKTIRLQSQGASCFCLSKNEELFASAFKNNQINLWSTPFGNECFSFEGHDQTIYSIKFTNDSLKLVSGGLDDYINIWDCESKQLFKRIYIDYGCLIIEIIDENRIIINEFNNDFKIYDIYADLVEDAFDKHFNQISAICLSKSFEFFATGGHDHKILVWNTHDWSYVSRDNAHEMCISTMCFSRDDNYLFSASKRSAIHMWDRETISLQRIFLCAESNISELFVSKDDKLIVAVHVDNIKFFQVTENECYSIKITENAGSIQYISPNLKHSIFIQDFNFFVWRIKLFERNN